MDNPEGTKSAKNCVDDVCVCMFYFIFAHGFILEILLEQGLTPEKRYEMCIDL